MDTTDIVIIAAIVLVICGLFVAFATRRGRGSGSAGSGSSRGNGGGSSRDTKI